ncbi:MAG TPA: sialidase family protein [Blastocatellia bacterium]|nr:sialidase family protein [Blastocatellia bacterium]
MLIGALAMLAPGQASSGLSLSVREMESPAEPAGGQPNLYAADGRVYLTWIAPKGERGHALRFAVRDGGLWSEARTIAEGENWFVNWADFPSLVALPGGKLAAHWLVKSGPGTYSYDVHIARSTDDGKIWSRPFVPHRDGKQTEHGFVSLLPWDGGRVAAMWLDGRNLKADSHESHGSSTGAMSLRFTTVGINGEMSEDMLLDPRVCECCQTSAALTADGAIVAYRDRSEKEVRDISVIRFSKGKWTQPQNLHPDGWHIEGCPVNGPSVAASERRVAVAWFTAANETARVKVAFSTDSGATFGQPIQVDEGSPVGRVDVLMLDDGSALVSWLERAAQGADIRLRRIQPDGSRDKSVIVAQSSAARASGFPQMARAGDEVIIAWTQAGTPPKVRVAAVRLSRS